MFQSARKIILIVSAFVGLASMTLYTILENTYVSYPRSPDPQLGRVVPHEAKGVVVYISQAQN